jgi:hypothetical protein
MTMLPHPSDHTRHMLAAAVRQVLWLAAVAGLLLLLLTLFAARPA